MAGKSQRPYRLFVQFVSLAKPATRGISSKSFHGQALEIRTRVANFARLIVEDFVVSAVDKEFEQVKREIARTVEQSVTEEVARMAKALSRGITQPEETEGPVGLLGIGQLSRQARERGWSSFDRAEAGIQWGPRSPRYMKHKRKTGKSPHWFKYTGQLESWFKQKANSPGYYMRSFGPVSVRFEEIKSESKTPKGKKGVQAKRVGRLMVKYFSRISNEMMPGQATFSPQSNPLPHPGVAVLLPDTKQRAKLLRKGFLREVVGGRRTGPRTASGYELRRAAAEGREPWKPRKGRVVKGEGKHRPAIDPFVSFYMTRAIPNAIWRRTERLTRG